MNGTPIYVYGIAARAPDLSRSGVAGAEVLAIEHGGLAAIVSPIATSQLRAKRRDILAHQEVLQEAFTDTNLVPLRFGTVFESGEAVIDELLGPRHDALVRMLKRFEGRVELSVRAYYVEEAVLKELVRDDRRIAAMRGRVGGVALGEAVAEALDAKRALEARGIERRLVPLAEDAAIEPARTAYELFRGAFLVRRKQVEAFDEAMNALAQQRDGVVVFKYVGPLPPHSFVGAEGGG